MTVTPVRRVLSESWSKCSSVWGSMVIQNQILRSIHAGMQVFAGATSDEGLLGLCDTILEALLFCPGLQTCLTCGALCQSFTTALKRPRSPAIRIWQAYGLFSMS